MLGVVGISLVLFAGLLFGLFKLQQGNKSLSRLVLMGLVAGSVFGVVLQLLVSEQHSLALVLDWVNLVGSGYVALLKMLIIPLVLVSMIAAVVKLNKGAALGKVAGITLGILLFTTAIAAFIGMVVAQVFDLSAQGLTQGAREAARLNVLQGHSQTVADLNIAHMLLSFIPTNPFADLAQARPTSIIAVVIFGVLLGIAAKMVMNERSDLASAIATFVESAQAIVMRLVKMIMALTPYGVAALMANVAATTSVADILNLLTFIVASYLAIGLMFVVHGVLVALVGVDPKLYFQKIWPVLTFAFTSRSSAATIALNVETQITKLNTPPAIANLSASFGATIGQNGCAGIYPAMLAVMVAPSVGINPFELEFMLSLMVVVVVSSFGIAGVGGGATFAALIVLPAMGLPVAIVALLISIEPLIDMARTALNVSGAMTAGTITGKLLNKEAVEEVNNHLLFEQHNKT